MSHLIADLAPRLFEGIAKNDVETIVSAAKLKSVSRGSVIQSQGTPASRFLMILEGRARHYFTTPSGDKLLLMWLTPGDCAGGAALLPNAPEYLVSTEIIRSGTLLLWDRPVIKRLGTQYPRLMENGLSIASDYLEWYVATHVALTCHSARERLAHLLAALVSHVGERGPSGITLEATNEELASAANVTPFTTSRFLAEWSKQGILRKRRGHLEVTNPAALWHVGH